MRCFPYVFPIMLLPAAFAAELPPVGDTYVVAQSGSAFGAQSNLLVAPGTRTLLQFDLSALPSGITSAQIARANLRLYVNRVTAPGQIDVAMAGSLWAEASATGLDNIAVNSTVASGITVPAGGSYLTVDVTNAVFAWLNGSRLNRGLVVSATAANPASVSFDSKENSTTSHPASLEVLYTGPAGPAGATGPQGPAGADAGSSLSDFCTALGYSNDDNCLRVLGVAKLVFVSSSTYTGQGVASASHADDLCQQEATLAGLTGQYKAWLSDLTTSPAARFTKSGHYRLTDPARTLLALSYAELVSTGPRARIQFTTNGNYSGNAMWTGTYANGTPTATNCANWTSSSPVVYGTAGTVILTKGRPSDWTDAQSLPCGAALSLYCFEQ